MKVTKAAILGAGNGGMTAAAEMKARGFQISLYEVPAFADNLKAMQAKGGLLLQEPGKEDIFCPLDLITTDLAEAIRDAQVIMLTIPGFAVETFSELLAPLVQTDQVIFFNGAAAMGCVRFVKKAKEMGIDKIFQICEVNSLAYGTRGFADEARVELSLRVKKLFFAAYPKERTAELMEMCRQIYDCIVPAENIWHTTLENGNPEVHPGPCLLNAGRIEYSGGEFWFYKEGITAHTLNVLQAISRERMAVGRAFGLDLEDARASRARRGYLRSEDGDLQEMFNTSEVYSKIKGPLSVTSRYFTEDISNGLVLWSDMGKLAGVPTPNINAVITLGSSLLEEDFYQTGLTLEKLGFGGCTLQDLVATV